MFTWLQTHIQKHHKIIFGIILVVVIISFVFTIGNFGGFGNPTNPNAGPRDFYGFNMNSARDVRALEQWTTISLALERQRATDQSVSYGVMQRAVMLNLAAQLQIPEPTKEQFQAYVGERPAFQDWRTGQFSQEMYTQFVDSFKNNPNMSEETLITALSQDFRIDQVAQALGGPGYVMPYFAVEEIKRRDTKWWVEIARMDAANFAPGLTINEEVLRPFYEENKARYETQPEIIAEYVSFPVSEFISEVAEPTEGELSAVYNQNRAKWPKNEEGVTKPLADIRDQVIAKYKEDKAQELALTEANKLAVALYDTTYEATRKGNDPKSVPLDALFTEFKVEPKELPPFSASKLDVGGVIPPAGLEQVLALDDNRFYTDGIKTPEGAAVVLVKETGATRIPEMQEVYGQVVADYTQYERLRQFDLKARDAEVELQAAVDAGKDFKAEAETLGFKVQAFDDFSVMQKPEGIDNFELSALSEMQEGEVSNLEEFNDVGTIIYVKKTDIPEVSPDSEEVVSEMDRMQSRIAMATEGSIVNELIAIGNKKLEAEDQSAL